MPVIESSASNRRWCYWRWCLLPAAIWWGALWGIGFPPPHIDDLFFTGTAMNLARGGSLSNPYLHGLSPPFTPDAFFLQPPLHSWVLAFWLKVWGISTASLMGFQAAVGFVFTAAVGYGCQTRNLSRLILCLMTGAYTGFTVTQGLRQDTLGVALLAVGMALLLEDRPWRWFAGFTCAGLATVTSPVIASWVIPASLGLLWWHWQNAKKSGAWNPSHLGQRLLLSGLAVLTVTGLFLLAIQWRWSEFWHDFMLHASYRRTPTWRAPLDYAGWITQQWRQWTDLPILIAGLVLLIVSFRKLRGQPVRQILLLVPVAAFGLNVLFYSLTFYRLAFLALLTLAGLAGGAWWTPWQRRGILTSTAGLLLLHHSIDLVKLVAQKPVDSEQVASLRKYVKTHPTDHYAIDYVAARYVFDYQLPEGSRAWDYYYFLPHDLLNSMAQREPGWTWIVARPNIGLHVPDSGINYPLVRCLGHEFHSLPARPYELILLPPQ